MAETFAKGITLGLQEALFVNSLLRAIGKDEELNSQVAGLCDMTLENFNKESDALFEKLKADLFVPTSGEPQKT